MVVIDEAGAHNVIELVLQAIGEVVRFTKGALFQALVTALLGSNLQHSFANVEADDTLETVLSQLLTD